MSWTTDDFRQKFKALGLIAPGEESIQLEAASPLEQERAQSELGTAAFSSGPEISKAAPINEDLPLPEGKLGKITGADRAVGEITGTGPQEFPEAQPLPQDEQMFFQGIRAERAPELENKVPEESSIPISPTGGKKLRDLTSEDVNPLAGIPPYVRPETNAETDRLLAAEEERLQSGEAQIDAPSPKEAPKEMAKDVAREEFKSTEPINPLERPELGDEAFKQAQETARQRQLIAGLGEAAGTFAAVAPGKQFDRSFYDEQYKQAQQPVENLKERRDAFLKNTQLANYLIDSQVKKMDLKQKQELEDPNTPGTKALKGIIEFTHKDIDFKKIPGWDQMNGREAETFSKYLQNYVTLERNKAKDRELSDYRQKSLELREKAAKPALSPFQKAAQQQEAKKYADVQSASTQADEQLTLIDDAIDTFKDYTQKSIGGTGPIATLGGLTQYASEDTQNLQAKFKLINVKNMAKTFQGMSRAIDSNTERRAWEATQASITNDDAVNANILLGSKALAIKAKAEAEAQRKFVEGSPDGTLNGYRSPILGKTSIVVNPDGEMQLVPKEKYNEFLKSGYRSLDNYAKNQILRIQGAKKMAKQTSVPSESRVSSQALVKKDPMIEKWAKEHNLNYERAEAIIQGRQNGQQ